MDLKVLEDIPPRVPTSECPAVLNTFPTMKNTRILQAARGLEPDKVPVWVMRQAGRYLPEFQEVKKTYDFFKICTTPALACEVTLQPIRRFPLDSAIIFSDILVVPQFLGMEVLMLPGKGPHFPEPLNGPEDISKLTRPDSSVFDPYLDSIYLTRHSLQGTVPLIGFTGGPFTLFTYMVEGGSSNAFTKSRKWVFSSPDETKRVLDLITEVVCEFLFAQICAGAQVLQVFESHGGLLGRKDFLVFILPYLTRIASYLKDRIRNREGLDVPLIVFAKDAGFVLEDLMRSDYDVVGIDWTVDIAQAKSLADRYGKAIQGNLDPALIYADKGVIEQRTREMVELAGKKGYIANLGHGIYPDCSPENLEVFINSVHSV